MAKYELNVWILYVWLLRHLFVFTVELHFHYIPSIESHCCLILCRALQWLVIHTPALQLPMLTGTTVHTWPNLQHEKYIGLLHICQLIRYMRHVILVQGKQSKYRNQELFTMHVILTSETLLLFTNGITHEYEGVHCFGIISLDTA
jgi:hypothetical protein